jgi:membrane associated rhomboid family serine protease
MEEKKNVLFESMKLPLAFLAAIWLIHIFQFIFNLHLGYLGVFPREWFGLKGIITSPLIHSDFSHLTNNSIPFLVLGTMMMFFYRKVAISSFFMIYFITGIAVWLLARQTYHVGLSGVVFGLVTFIMSNGFFRRNMRSIVLALIVFLLYSGMLAGVFPMKEGISWESHLYGALAGIFTAYYYKEELEAEEEDPYAEDESDLQNDSYFLPRDIFEKTKEERRREAEGHNDGWFSDSTFDL